MVKKELWRSPCYIIVSKAEERKLSAQGYAFEPPRPGKRRQHHSFIPSKESSRKIVLLFKGMERLIELVRWSNPQRCIPAESRAHQVPLDDT
jgi:hypothetical protein